MNIGIMDCISKITSAVEANTTRRFRCIKSAAEPWMAGFRFQKGNIYLSHGENDVFIIVGEVYVPKGLLKDYFEEVV